MAANISASVSASSDKRPLTATILAIFSWVLAIITGIPQFYYVLTAAGLAHIGPNGDPIGQLWYWYVLHGETGYQNFDAGAAAGAVLDAFLLAPLYLTTGIGLWRRKAWVYQVGLLTGAMIFYAILYFFLLDGFSGFKGVTDDIVYWTTSLLYLIYPVWLVATLLLRRGWFSK